MPPRNNSKEPPPVMTWKKAIKYLIAGGVFDLLRLFFTMFWFFGPALGAVYCALKAQDTLGSWTFGLLGIKTAGAICGLFAAKAGALASAVTVPFGTVMADAVDLFGFLILGVWILMSNSRILKANASAVLKFSGGTAIGAIPVIGGLVPVFTFTLWRLFKTQIRVEEAAYKKWEKETAVARAQKQKQQMAYITQVRGMQQARFTQQKQAENDALYEQTRAANDNEYPQELQKAA